MKLINSVVMLMILVGGSQSVYGEILDCEFKNMVYGTVGVLYSCYIRSLLNPHNNLTIDGYSGEHMENKNDADVKGISIIGTNTEYIPTNLGSLFDLTSLTMKGTKLVKIKAKDFHEMQNLKELFLFNNNLKSVPLDAFVTLTKLKIISLGSNQIEELPNGIFVKNLKLEYINLAKNNIKYLGAELLTGLRSLIYVDLEDNICFNESYSGSTQIIQLKEDIKMKCKKPDEVSETTTATTTTLNPMEVKLIEMQEKISKLEKELRTRIMNEDALTKERDALMQKNFDLNQNLFDTKRELQMLKTTCGVIRNNLKKAKEDLVNCSNANPRDLLLK